MGLLLNKNTLKTKMSNCFAYSDTREKDLALILAANVYLGTQNCSKKMKPYIYTRNKEGIYCIHIGKTWEKLMIAARIVAAVDNPKDCSSSPTEIWPRELFSSSLTTLVPTT